MDTFIFLKIEHDRIEQQLQELIGSFDQMTNAKRFECTTLIFGEIKVYFAHQESLLARTSNDVADFLSECLRDRKEITEAVDRLLMSHVDDDDFRIGLRKLLLSFDAHLKHYDDKLFVHFREQLSPQELRNMDSQTTDWMLGSSFASRF